MNNALFHFVDELEAKTHNTQMEEMKFNPTHSVPKHVLHIYV